VSQSARPIRHAEASPRDDADLNPRSEPAIDFRDRDLVEMTPADYDTIGFMSGLEVHQQLHTERKLFCRCPAGRRSTEVDATVLRQMRPTLSELGKYDACALMEFKTNKEIVYLLERGSVCTYELDDTPPFEIDPESVAGAVEMALMFDLKLVSELHVMRKQYLDGSIPTGFQRTALVGIDGVIPFRVPELGVERELRIRQLSLEEDSCREVSDVGHWVTFRTDRLGTPLIETVTEPDLLTPWELQAGAQLLARNARATRRVRRGPGAARQDVNVSVAGGRRVELKGVSHHRGLPYLTHVEAFRQLNLLRIRAELVRRGVDRDALRAPEDQVPWEASPLVIDASSILANASHEPIRLALERGERSCAIRLPGFAGILAWPTQPGLPFAHELAERVRVIACITRPPFLTHTDDPRGGLDAQNWRELRAALGADRADAVVVAWGPALDLETAALEILARARAALDGVPSETRMPRPDGTTGFERLLPGPERMYPDTDTPPLAIADSEVDSITLRLHERPWQRLERWRALGLDEATATRLLDAPWADLFDELAPADPVTARRLAHGLQKRLTHHWRRTGTHELPTTARLAPIVRAVEKQQMRPEAFERALDRLLAAPARTPATILGKLTARGDEQASLGDAQTLVRTVRSQLRSADPAAGRRWAMGLAMPALIGRVDPAELEQRLHAPLTEPDE